MKSLATIAAASLLSLASITPQVSADQRIPVGHGQLVVNSRASCGCPIHSRRICTSYDHRNRPVYTNYRQPFICSCNKSGEHATAVRKYNQRRDNQYQHFQKRLSEAYDKYQRDLEKASRNHRSELAGIERDRNRNPAKYRDRRENEYRNYQERLRKIDASYKNAVDKANRNNQKELDEYYRDFLKDSSHR